MGSVPNFIVQAMYNAKLEAWAPLLNKHYYTSNTNVWLYIFVHLHTKYVDFFFFPFEYSYSDHANAI